jgi:dihydroorotase-like cyclic amidohydrolase
MLHQPRGHRPDWIPDVFDRLFENAVDLHGNPLCLAVKNGRFAEIAPNCDASLAADVIDLKGRLVLP